MDSRECGLVHMTLQTDRTGRKGRIGKFLCTIALIQAVANAFGGVLVLDSSMTLGEFVRNLFIAIFHPIVFISCAIGIYLIAQSEGNE